MNTRESQHPASSGSEPPYPPNVSAAQFLTVGQHPACCGSTPSCSPNLLPRLALSPDEAARAIGVSRDYLDEHVMPELRIVRRGRRKLIAVAELERWLAAAAARTLKTSRGNG